MNLHDLLSSPFVYRLGWTLLHSLWQVAAVAAVLWLTLAVLRRRSPQSRYLAASLAMAAVLAATVVTFSLVPAPADPPARTAGDKDIRDSRDSRDNNDPALAIAPAADPEPLPASSASSSPLRVSESPRLGVSPDSPLRVSVSPRLRVDSSLSSRAAQALQPLLPWLVSAWLAGVLLLSLWRTGGYVAACRLRTLATRPVPAPLAAVAARLAAALGLRRPVRILQSAIAQMPLVIGWLRPVILLPLSALSPVTGLSPAHLEAVLAHELAHIRRLDGLFNLLQALLETLFFYHPALWWISRRMRLDRERCCDDLAVLACGNRIGYVEALAALVESHAQRPAPSFALASSISGVSGVSKKSAGSDLLARIRRLLGLPDPASSFSGRPLAAALVVLLALALPVALHLSARAGDTPPAPATLSTVSSGGPVQKAFEPAHGSVVADLRNGVRIELVALWNGRTPEQRNWWLADGRPAPGETVARCEEVLAAQLKRKPALVGRWFRFGYVYRTSAPEAESPEGMPPLETAADVYNLVHGVRGHAYGAEAAEFFPDTPENRRTGVNSDGRLTQADKSASGAIRFIAATGPWRLRRGNTYQFAGRFAAIDTRWSSSGEDADLFTYPLTESPEASKPGTMIDATFQRPIQVRLVYQTSSGKSIPARWERSDVMESFPNWGQRMTKAHFFLPAAPSKMLQAFAASYRPYCGVTFRDVAYAPGAAAKPSVELVGESCPDRPADPKVAAWIDRLTSPQAKVRQEARKELMDLGNPALEALDAAAGEPNARRAAAAGEIARQIRLPVPRASLDALEQLDLAPPQRLAAEGILQAQAAATNALKGELRFALQGSEGWTEHRDGRREFVYVPPQGDPLKIMDRQYAQDMRFREDLAELLGPQRYATYAKWVDDAERKALEAETRPATQPAAARAATGPAWLVPLMPPAGAVPAMPPATPQTPPAPASRPGALSIRYTRIPLTTITLKDGAMEYTYITAKWPEGKTYPYGDGEVHLYPGTGSDSALGGVYHPPATIQAPAEPWAQPMFDLHRFTKVLTPAELARFAAWAQGHGLFSPRLTAWSKEHAIRPTTTPARPLGDPGGLVVTQSGKRFEARFNYDDRNLPGELKKAEEDLIALCQDIQQKADAAERPQPATRPSTQPAASRIPAPIGQLGAPEATRPAAARE